VCYILSSLAAFVDQVLVSCSRYPAGHPVAFGTWAMTCFPNMIVMLIIAWVYLMIFFMGIR